MQKVVFSSAQLPVQLDENARFAQWEALCSEFMCTFEQSRVEGRPFEMDFEFAQAGATAVGRYQGTLNGVARTKSGIATDGSDDFSLCVNTGASTVRLRQNGRDILIEPGQSFLFAHFESWKWEAEGATASFSLNLPRQLLADRVRAPEDFMAAALNGHNPYLQHLWRYIEFLLGPGGAGVDPLLEKHIETTLADLLALALGAGGEAGEIARLRGLRAARLQEILSTIKTRFSDPALTTDAIGRSLGLSRRYVNDLLQETGASFADRIMELRLQKARAMLASLDNRHLKVSEIAFACGFNEVSYFNRRFRARFGASPTQYRAVG